MPPIRILRRSSYDRTIDVACPHCEKPLAVSAKNVERLEDGVEVIGPCEHCGERVEFQAGDLDGPIWLPTCPKCGWPIDPAKHGAQSAFADESARGAGLAHGVVIPASCSNPACDWVDRATP